MLARLWLGLESGVFLAGNRRSGEVAMSGKKKNDSDQKIERKEQQEEPVAIAQPGADPFQNPIHRSL